MAKDLFTSMSISASGMSAQRKRMEAISQNIANAETTRGENGEAYKRKRVIFSTNTTDVQKPAAKPRHSVTLAQTAPGHLAGGKPVLANEPSQKVEAIEVEDPNAESIRVYDPQHPDADAEGYVSMPDINMVTEMVDMIAATRAYEANLSAMKAYQSITEKSLEI